MKYTSKQYAQAIWEVWQEKSEKEKKTILGSFVKLIKKQRDLKKISFIEKELEKIYLDKNNLLKTKLITPYSPSKLSIGQIKNFISKNYDYKPDSIILEQKIDENLIGGFQIKVNDYLIDGSIRNNLSKLRESLRI